MIERHNTVTYSQSFAKFLAHTNEKAILLEQILKKIKQIEPANILDIGAGNGELALPVSKLVKNYLAVEYKSDYVEKLRSLSLNVIESAYPCEIEQKFDFILSSHSLPWKQEKYKPFIECAMNQLSDKGVFLIITYDNESGDWFNLLEKNELQLVRNNSNRLGQMTEWLENTYKLNKETIIANVECEKMDDLIEALAFVYSDGDQNLINNFIGSEKVRAYIEEKYKFGDKYIFPFEHIFIILQN